jgi:guanylate kinase
MKHSLLIVVSAPSGAGKSTLCDRVLADSGDIVYSVSCTTRKPRGQEVDGVDYNFLTPDAFDERIKSGDFLEYATVHGNSYGTLKDTVRSAMDAGKSVMMDIDVQGAAQVREALRKLPVDDAMRRGFVDIFIEPPSVEELRSRLTGRGEDAPDVIEQRLKNAESEMASAGLYKYTVVNDDLDLAFSELSEILKKEAQS